MRIITWNVNGIRAIEKKGFISWLSETNPDILCINETKASPDQLSQQLLKTSAGGKPYLTYWASAKKKGYSGVAIYSKEEPQDLRFLGIKEFDDEGRVLIADYCIKGQDLSLISAYFPNSQEGGMRLNYKLAFCDSILNLCKCLVKKGRNIILCGDYNIAHTPIDLAHPKANEKSAGYLPEERAWMDKFTNSGYVDTFRHFHPGEKNHYTWWSYRSQARKNNIGWRIDYHCVNRDLLPKVKSAIIRSEVLGSDHCPVELELEI